MSARCFTTFLLAACSLAVATPARAWDPVQTHPALVHRAALDSQVHVRWMEASDQTLGLFSAIRLDPDALAPEPRAAIRRALDQVPASSGIGVRGGPHACPGASAPPSTQLRCVEGDLWEASALGWIKLGLIVEGDPRARILHHFVDRRDPRSLTWADTELPATTLRYAARRAGMPLAQSINRTGFDGRARSAIAWLQDTEDPWSLPATRAHLHRAATDPDPDVRQQALVLGLIGAGAILHVIQDLTVPAHARGDLSAFFLPLSDQRGDLGLPLQEFARLAYGQSNLPQAVSLTPRLAPTSSLEALLWGDTTTEGLIPFTATRFFSESSLPPPRVLEASLSAQDAAARLLGPSSGIAESELRGAKLEPWPASAGYLKTSSGRALAAFSTDHRDRVALFLDRAVYREQAGQLLPRAVAASAVLLDLLFPAAPDLALDRSTGTLHIDLRDRTTPVPLSIWHEAANGRRQLRGRYTLPPGRPVELAGLSGPSDETLIILIEGPGSDGPPSVAIHRVPALAEAPSAESSKPPPPPRPRSEGDAQPTATDGSAASPPRPADPEPPGERTPSAASERSGESKSPGERDTPPQSGSPGERKTPPQSGSPGERKTPPQSGSPGERDTPPQSGSPGERKTPPQSDSPGERNTPPQSGSPGEHKTPPPSDSPGERKTPP